MKFKWRLSECCWLLHLQSLLADLCSRQSKLYLWDKGAESNDFAKIYLEHENWRTGNKKNNLVVSRKWMPQWVKVANLMWNKIFLFSASRKIQFPCFSECNERIIVSIDAVCSLSKNVSFKESIGSTLNMSCAAHNIQYRHWGRTWLVYNAADIF